MAVNLPSEINLQNQIPVPATLVRFPNRVTIQGKHKTFRPNGTLTVETCAGQDTK
jgi:hypothetical protein